MDPALAIKSGLGRDDFQVNPRRFWRMLITHDYRELPVRSEHTIAVGDLPLAPLALEAPAFLTQPARSRWLTCRD